jgi:hypothetical protein
MQKKHPLCSQCVHYEYYYECIALLSPMLLPRYIMLFRDLRKGTGVFGDTVTQLHAWWHLFAGMGTYMHLIVRLIYIKYTKYVHRYKSASDLYNSSYT